MSDLSPQEYYNTVRSQIEHEDSLVSQRLSWFITSQSFLFTAYAIVTVNVSARPAAQWLMFLLPLIAVCTCVLILITICAGAMAMRALRAQYRHHGGEASAPHLPPIQGAAHTQLMGLSGPLLLPPLFLAVWLFLLIRAVFG